MTTCPAWDDDSPAELPRIVANIKGLWPAIERSAGSRTVPDLDLALEWHRAIYAGVAVPEPDYVGNVRDSDPALPCLVGYEVIVGTSPGTPAANVPASLDAFIRAAQTATSALDAATTPGIAPTDPATASAVVRLCALGHGEWIRIHPFANGNGRTARIWANWFAVRYGLPPFVRIKPRPDDVLFSGAAYLSMRGDHRPTEAMFVAMLRDALRP
ncbi:MAG: Fic family protein [Chloroflexota bacterium]